MIIRITEYVGSGKPPIVKDIDVTILEDDAYEFKKWKVLKKINEAVSVIELMNQEISILEDVITLYTNRYIFGKKYEII